MSELIDRINAQRERIDALKAARNRLAGEVEQLERSLAEGMARLREEHGLGSIEEADRRIVELEAQVKADEARVERMLREAEASLNKEG